MTPVPVHPLGTKARILLSSVFGPYARDDEYGSRKSNPMELYQNQVTRTQGSMSLRMFHRSFGLIMLQANIEAPCTLLDFPSLDGFIQEIQGNAYDIIGIGAIMTNTEKVRTMCDLIRKYQPRAVIVIGGHIANREGLDRIIDADHIVRGDGIAWFRKYLGQDENAPVKHPMVLSAFGTRTLGITLPDPPGSTAAILIPSVGCPVGCNFCSTSAMFGGKGKFINFFETGDELFTVMSKIEAELKVDSFFVLDENFLLHRKRALRLLELMKENNKTWSLSVFSSARVLQSYDLEQLVGLGVSFVWMGLEGEDSQYAKLGGIDTRRLVKKLQAHGIRVLGSSIIGLENHTPENIGGIIDYAVSHDTDFHQFMLYTPVHGTPLYKQHLEDGTLYSDEEFPTADAHGQYRFNYRHPHFHDGEEEQALLNAFNRDFEVNGPSLARLIKTTLAGYQKYKNHPDKRVRARYALAKKSLKTTYAGGVWAMKQWYRRDRQVAPKLKALLKELYAEFGWTTRIVAAAAGIFLYAMMKREDRRMAKGWTYEPHFFREKNEAALAVETVGPERAGAKTAGTPWVKRAAPSVSVASTNP